MAIRLRRRVAIIGRRTTPHRVLNVNRRVASKKPILMEVRNRDRTTMPYPSKPATQILQHRCFDRNWYGIEWDVASDAVAFDSTYCLRLQS